MLVLWDLGYTRQSQPQLQLLNPHVMSHGCVDTAFVDSFSCQVWHQSQIASNAAFACSGSLVPTCPFANIFADEIDQGDTVVMFQTLFIPKFFLGLLLLPASDDGALPWSLKASVLINQ